MEQLKLCELSTVVYQLLVEEFLARNKYDYSWESMRLVLNRMKRVLGDVENRKEGTCHFAMVVRDFDSELISEWIKYLSSEDNYPLWMTLSIL